MDKAFDSAYVKTRKSMGYDKAPSQGKAKQMMKDSAPQGRAMSKKQKGPFGAVAGAAKRKK